MARSGAQLEHRTGGELGGHLGRPPGLSGRPRARLEHAVVVRDVQRAEDQWSRAKGFDSACPLGPWVETEVDPADLAITCTVNGELRQAGRTGQMLRSVADLIVHVSQSMTLLPGDVVLTGTPAGVGALHVGDEVAVSIEGIGTLTNRVVKS